MAVLWCASIAFEIVLDGGRLTTPWHALALVRVGALGGAAGAGLAVVRSFRGRAADLLLWCVPLDVAALAVTVSIVASRDTLLDAGGCLDGTDYSPHG